MSKKDPLVSIICTNFNKGEWIKEAIESFLSQKTDFDFEIILIDDKSFDGSEEIIKDYAKKYPEKITAIFNEENLGITKTWIKVCEFARGKYIARCDGDDYWIDDEKLQKQVDLLKKHKKSLWCSTDYNIIDSEGKTLETEIFKKGIVKRAESFEEILVTVGFTNASTWLIDANLAKQINKKIAIDAVDDTFNIQLELFSATNLTFLPESTVVYRQNDDSDSHPIDPEKMNSRIDRLLSTQMEYLQKGGFDVGESLAEAMKYSATLNKVLNSKENHIKILNQEKTQMSDEISKQKAIIDEIINSRSYKIIEKIRKIKDKLK